MTGFGDLHEYAWGPRVGSVALSPDGTWVALAMQTVGDTPPKYLTSIWRVDTEPGSVPARLTRSAEGEGSPAFLPDGSLAFVSRRPDGISLGEQKRADAYPIWERVQQEVAAEFDGAEVQELLIRLRRLTGGSERLAGIRTEVDR